MIMSSVSVRLSYGIYRRHAGDPETLRGGGHGVGAADDGAGAHPHTADHAHGEGRCVFGSHRCVVGLITFWFDLVNRAYADTHTHTCTHTRTHTYVGSPASGAADHGAGAHPRAADRAHGEGRCVFG